MARSRALLPGLVVAALLGSGLSACTGSGTDEREASAQAYADRLVEGVLATDLDGLGVTGTDDATGDLDTALGDLAELVAAREDDGAVLTAATARVEDDRAVVPLTWRWSLAGTTWRYRTRVALRLEVGPEGNPVSDRSGEPVWTAAWSPRWVHPAMRAGDSLELLRRSATRGDVLGADDRPVVVERDVVRLGVDKTRLEGADPARAARRLARAVGVSAGPYVDQVVAAGDQAFVPALTVRAEGSRRLVRRVGRIAGGLAFATSEPLAPTADFAAPLLGRVGPATAEAVAAADGAVSPGDVVGLSGLQARYDERLRGTPGVVVQRVDGTGEVVESLHDVEPTAGDSLRLTLDVDLQQRAQQVLAGVPAAAGATALVAVRPSDGAVLAAASGQGAAGLATATFGAEPPGSTFKIVSALALLRAGATPSSPLRCDPTTLVNGRRFSNYDGYPAAALGRIDLRTALAQSCNTAFIAAADRVDPDDVADAAAALGFGVDHDMGYPVSFGQVPEPGSETEAAADLIGQGRVTASPVAMAVVVASVAAGEAVLPRLVEGVEVDRTPPAQPLTPREARRLRSMLGTVVSEGSGQVLADVGATGAKTGTAQYGEPGPGGVLPTHAWMVATRGDLAVAAYVQDGDSGSGTAGPLIEQLLRGLRR